MQYSLRQKSRGVSCIRCYTTKFVNYKDLKPFVKDLKEVYQAATEKLALTSCITSYVVSVRQTRDLPVVSLFPHPASFRFPSRGHPCLRLYPSHCRVDSGLAPIRNLRRQAHIKKAEQDAGISACHLIQLLFLTNNYPPMNHRHSILFFSQSQEILTEGIPR